MKKILVQKIRKLLNGDTIGLQSGFQEDGVYKGIKYGNEYLDGTHKHQDWIDMLDEKSVLYRLHIHMMVYIGFITMKENHMM